MKHDSLPALRIARATSLPADGHVLVVAERGHAAAAVPGKAHRDRVRARAGLEASAAVSADVGNALVAWVEWDPAKSVHASLSALRGGSDLLLKEKPQRVTVIVHASAAAARRCAEEAVYVLGVNGRYDLGRRVPGKKARELMALEVRGAGAGFDGARALAVARGNLLARELTLMPPNALGPRAYRQRVAVLAKEWSCRVREYDVKSLRKLGAGAFLAVAQGSPHDDAAIVRVSYRPKNARGAPVALVGKGICMDTGGHGIKTAKGMYGMHEDMSGSAVVLGILSAVVALELPIAVDAWLAIAENHIGPSAYQPGDVVTAIDGTSIEVVHTDAEGRMVLADTLALASREKPRLMIDFATLTGAMIGALGTRVCGVFANQAALGAAAVSAGERTGERVCLFPMDGDYDAALESKVADVKQCLISGEADAIYGARFLSRFAGPSAWVHVDLSAHRCDGGLGAVSDALTGFGVAWGLEMIAGTA